MRTRQGEMTTGRAGHAAGFTLIETAIAMMILMVAALGVGSLFLYAANNNSGGFSRTLALTVAQHEVERLRNLPFDDAQLAATVANPPAKTITRSGGAFLVTTTVVNVPGSAPLPATAIKRKIITIRVLPSGNRDGWAGAPVTLITTRSAGSAGPYMQ